MIGRTRAANDKTWANLKTHFEDIFNKNQRYGGTTAQGHGFGEAANSAEEEPKGPTPDQVFKEATKEVALAATADNEHIQQMFNTNDDMLALVKRQQATIERQSKQIDDLIEQNGKLTEALSNLKPDQPRKPPRTNPRGGGRGGGANKRPRIEKDPKGDADNSDNDEKPECAICSKTHKTEDCYELECNAHKRWKGWKSIFA